MPFTFSIYLLDKDTSAFIEYIRTCHVHFLGQGPSISSFDTEWVGKLRENGLLQGWGGVGGGAIMAELAGEQQQADAFPYDAPNTESVSC